MSLQKQKSAMGQTTTTKNSNLIARVTICGEVTFPQWPFDLSNVFQKDTVQQHDVYQAIKLIQGWQISAGRAVAAKLVNFPMPNNSPRSQY